MLCVTDDDGVLWWECLARAFTPPIFSLDVGNAFGRVMH